METNEVRRVELDLDLTQMRAKDRELGLGLGTMAAYGADLNGAKLKVVLSVGMERKRQLKARIKDGLMDMVQHSKMVIGAKLIGRETPEGQIEVVDLLDGKLIAEAIISIGPGRRLDQEERFRALISARNHWRESLK